jgi:hypothetical protein
VNYYKPFVSTETKVKIVVKLGTVG